MVVRVDDVANRLVGNRLVDRFDHRQHAPFVLRRLDERGEIAELDSHAVVGAAREVVHTLSQLGRLHAHRWNRRVLHRRGDRHGRPAGVDLDVLDV